MGQERRDPGIAGDRDTHPLNSVLNLRPRQETDFTATTAQMLGDGQHHVVDPLGVPARALRGAEYMPHKGFEHRFIGS